MTTEDFQYPTHTRYSGELGMSSISQRQGLCIIVVFFFTIILLVTFLIFHLFSSYEFFSPAQRNGRPPLGLIRPVAIASVSLGLDAATIDSLPIFMHKSLAADLDKDDDSTVVTVEIECSICLGLFEEDEVIKVLPECLHAYHSECVDKWLRTRSSCPLCRTSLDSTKACRDVGLGSLLGCRLGILRKGFLAEAHPHSLTKRPRLFPDGLSKAQKQLRSSRQNEDSEQFLLKTELYK
ncbi:hypothetical protein RJ640_025945 [Escallonia rubra]|uniref:RING-type domain-containing protein n=1 Tax=Escallonia rubra TaxID=112253 RepID=A0AA88UNN4_9ASTE|nr:hypothetical protein RJ640_025945 [Escallonia rubra]